jgi:MFS family permease
VPVRIRKWLRDGARAFAVTGRNRDLRRAQLAFGATWTAEWAFMVALGVVAFRDGGATAVGIVAFIRVAPSAVIAPFGTALGDRFRRDRVLVGSCLIRALATAAAALLLAIDGSMIGVYALAVLATAAFTVFRPVHSALLPLLSMTPLDLTSANIVRGLVDSLSTLIGPLVAALVLDVGSAAAVFGVVAVLALCSGTLLIGLTYEAPPPGSPQPLRRIVAETVEGFRASLRNRDAALLIGLDLAQTFTRGCLSVFLVVVSLELLHNGEPGVGVLTGAVGAGAVAGSLGALMLVSGRRLAEIQGIGVALWGLPLTLSGAFPNEAAVLLFMCVVGVGNALVDVGLFTLMARLIPDELLARAFGALESLIALSVALGSLATPLAIDLLGVRGALAVIGLLAPALVALAWGRLRSIDASVAHRDKEIEVLKRVAMLRPLPMPAIENLAAHLDQIEVAPGQDVFRQGEVGDSFYVIEDGEAEVIGDGHFVHTMGAGDGFGEIALIRGTPRTATVRARTPMVLYSLERRHFVPAVSGYASSAHEAETLVHDRLGTYTPTGDPAGRA